MTVYAISKRTKRHVWNPADPAELVRSASGHWRIVQADADGWIPWGGGECPLPDGEKHDVLFSDGEAVSDDTPETWWWRGDDSDPIIAYRPILDADDEPEAPEWNGEGLPPGGCEAEMTYGDEVAKANVLAHDGDTVVCYVDLGTMGFYEGYDASELRPIRSAEDRAVEDMANVMTETVDFPKRYRLWDMARALYRAGYRRE